MLASTNFYNRGRWDYLASESQLKILKRADSFSFKREILKIGVVIGTVSLVAGYLCNFKIRQVFTFTLVCTVAYVYLKIEAEKCKQKASQVVIALIEKEKAVELKN